MSEYTKTKLNLIWKWKKWKGKGRGQNMSEYIKTEVAYPGIDKQYYVNERNAEAQNILAIGNVIERKKVSVTN